MLSGKLGYDASRWQYPLSADIPLAEEVAATRVQLMVGGGKVLPAPPSFSGALGGVRFDWPAVDVLGTIMREWLEHHTSLTHGDYTPALETMARLLDLPALRL